MLESAAQVIWAYEENASVRLVFSGVFWGCSLFDCFCVLFWSSEVWQFFLLKIHSFSEVQNRWEGNVYTLDWSQSGSLVESTLALPGGFVIYFLIGGFGKNICTGVSSTLTCWERLSFLVGFHH